MQTAFDRALHERALREAADAYAFKRGNADSPEYRAAWIRFRQNVRTVDDLKHWRTPTARALKERRTGEAHPSRLEAFAAKAP